MTDIMTDNNEYLFINECIMNHGNIIMNEYSLFWYIGKIISMYSNHIKISNVYILCSSIEYLKLYSKNST